MTRLYRAPDGTLCAPIAPLPSPAERREAALEAFSALLHCTAPENVSDLIDEALERARVKEPGLATRIA